MSYRRRWVKRTAGALLLSFSLVGCGTIFGGTSETINVNSAPSGASITTRPETATFTTPASIKLERKHNYTITASKEGYDSEEFLIRRSLRGGILVLDILFTALIGVVVDAITGGWYKLEPKTATIALERTDVGMAGPERIEVTITITDDGQDATASVEATEPGVLLEIQKN